ncbi:hypothetical protein [Cupriavidus necator]|uniref:hypothetical protein n=1 Tax=Cupriavidus necator TaxID=106590 RepID=UPI00339DA5FD
MFRIHMLSKMLGAAAPLSQKPGTAADSEVQHAVQPQAQSDAQATPAAGTSPPATHPATSTEPGLPEQFARNLKTQGDAMVQYGARLLVIRELLFSLAASLPPASRAGVERRFRQRIDQLLALTDDRVLPGEFHDTLLAEINYYLRELKA